MKRFFLLLSSIAGAALYAIAALIALVYLPGVVLFIGAPLFAALFMTLLMMAPLLIVGWILMRAGRPAPRVPRPWYRVRHDGKLARHDARDDQDARAGPSAPVRPAPEPCA